MADAPVGAWKGHSTGLSGSISKWVTVTPSNTVALPNGPCRAVTVKDDTGGNLVALIFADGTTETVYIAKGQVHPTIATHVKVTGTTATTIQVGY